MSDRHGSVLDTQQRCKEIGLKGDAQTKTPGILHEFFNEKSGSFATKQDLIDLERRIYRGFLKRACYIAFGAITIILAALSDLNDVFPKLW